MDKINKIIYDFKTDIDNNTSKYVIIEITNRTPRIIIYLDVLLSISVFKS